MALVFKTLALALARPWNRVRDSIRHALRGGSAWSARSELERETLARRAKNVSITVNGLSLHEYEERHATNTAAEFLENLAFTVATLDILTPQERLWILTELAAIGTLNKRVACDIYMRSGCRREAAYIFEKIGHWRKLGDVALADGAFDRALEFYSRPSSRTGDSVYRGGPDFDRIMEVNFLRGDWAGFLAAFHAADVEAFESGKVVLGGSVKSSARWARRVAIAASSLGMDADHDLKGQALRAFQLTDGDWKQMLAWARALSKQRMDAEINSAMPRALAKPSVTLESALATGATERARRLVAWIRSSPVDVRRASEDMQAWMNTGDRDALQRATAWVTGGDNLYKLTECAWFELTGRKNMLNGPAERVCEAYQIHPHTMRLGFGHYILLKLRSEARLTGEDLLGGVFQALAWPTREFEQQSEDEITVARLQSCDAWAEVRLDEWSLGEGADHIAKAVNALLHLDLDRMHDIRRQAAWVELMNEAVAWLSPRWREEIGISPWISEQQAFQLVKRRFKGKTILLHDQPLWLAPQHLDITVADINLAVEYMGLQHYKAVDVFGGEEAFRRTVERDKRKRELCRAAGVVLEYIRYDEDIGARVEEIYRLYGDQHPENPSKIGRAPRHRPRKGR